MTDEQTTRAFALAIAEIKNKGNFIGILQGESSIVELTERQSNYLAAIERYITANNHRQVTLSNEQGHYSGEILISQRVPVSLQRNVNFKETFIAVANSMQMVNIILRITSQLIKFHLFSSHAQND